jgi:hypothetical protein
MGIFTKLFGKRSPEPLWSQFQYQQNDETILMKKAIALAPLIIYFVKKWVPEVQPSKKWENIFLEEYLIIALHLVDRLAFAQLGPDRRDWLLNPLLAEIIGLLSIVLEDEAAVRLFKKEFYLKYDARCPAYAPLDIVVKPNEQGGSSRRTIGFKLAEILKDASGAPLELALIEHKLILDLTLFNTALVVELQLRQLLGK